MRRFFVEEIREGKGALVLRGAEANHIRTVLRMAPGDRLVLLDSRGARYEAVDRLVDRREVTVNLERPLPSPPPSPVEITLCQALLRSHSMDLIIQKTSELGVDRILPFVSERTIVKPDEGSLCEQAQALAGNCSQRDKAVRPAQAC